MGPLFGVNCFVLDSCKTNFSNDVSLLSPFVLNITVVFRGLRRSGATCKGLQGTLFAVGLANIEEHFVVCSRQYFTSSFKFLQHDVSFYLSPVYILYVNRKSIWGMNACYSAAYTDSTYYVESSVYSLFLSSPVNRLC